MTSKSTGDTTLFLLDFGTSRDPNDPLHRGRLIRATPDGDSFTTLIDKLYLPDSIDVHNDARRLCWTCMGIPGSQDGSVHSCNYDGTDVQLVLTAGELNTPKQLVVDQKGQLLYVCDREGLRIVRCALDGSGLEDLVVTGHASVADQKSDQMRWCGGLAIDWQSQKMYWTQKGTLSFLASVNILAMLKQSNLIESFRSQSRRQRPDSPS